MSNEESTETVQLRRAPRVGVFLGLGVILGILTALILTSIFPVDPNVGFGPLFGYLAVYAIPTWVVIMAVVALILDRRSSRRARTVAAVHEHPSEGGDSGAVRG